LPSRLLALALLVCCAEIVRAQERQAEATEPQTGVAGAKSTSAISDTIPAGVPYQPLTAKQRWKFYFTDTYLSFHSYIRAPMAGFVDQEKDRPPQWKEDEGWSGFARRAGSAWGRYAIRDTYEAVSAQALGYEVRYVRCGCSSFGQRLGYAIASSLFTRDRNGRIVPAVTRIGGEFGAEYSARLWLRSSYQNDSRIARGVLFQTGIRSLVNTYREFKPEIKQALHWK